MRWTVSIEFNPQEVWIGVSHEQRHNDVAPGLVLPDPTIVERHIWIGLIPCVRIHLVHTRVVASHVGGFPR
jgi:hypothetical protein